MLRSFIATASLGISNVSSWVKVRTNLAGFPAQSSPLGILLPGGTTDPASRIECVSTKEPSIRMECCPMMHSGSIVQDLNRLYAPIVTNRSIDVSAGSPVDKVNWCFSHFITISQLFLRRHKESGKSSQQRNLFYLSTTAFALTYTNHEPQKQDYRKVVKG